MKLYLKKVKDNSANMLERLNADLAHEQEDISETERTAENLETLLLDAQEELKATKRQRIRDMARHPEQEAILEETYDELEHDLIQRINGLQNQLQMAADKRNTIIQVNRAAKTAMEVFDDLLSKEHLDRKDLQLIIEKIKVYEDHLEIRLKADIDCLLRCGELPHEEDFVAAMARQGGNVNFLTAREISQPLPSSKAQKCVRTRSFVPMLSATATRWRSIPAGMARSSSKSIPSWAGWMILRPSFARL